MRRLINLDSPLMQGLTIITDAMLANLMFILCSVPIFTIGTALTAMAKVSQNSVLDEGSGVTRSFLRAFKENFKQTVLLWIVIMILGAILVADLLFVDSMLAGWAQKLGFCLWVLPTTIYVGVLSWLFPLIARYDNTVKGHLKNALALTFGKFPRTLIMSAVTMLPFFLLVFDAGLLLKTSILWIIFGFGFLAYFNALLMRPVFRALEAAQEEQEEDEPEAQ